MSDGPTGHRHHVRAPSRSEVPVQPADQAPLVAAEPIAAMRGRLTSAARESARPPDGEPGPYAAFYLWQAPGPARHPGDAGS